MMSQIQHSEDFLINRGWRREEDMEMDLLAKEMSKVQGTITVIRSNRISSRKQEFFRIILEFLRNTFS